MTTRRPGLKVIAATLALAGAALVGTALAGPPMVCFPYDNGGAKSLPMGKGHFETSSGYDTANLVKDTLELLKTERSTLARMETLRRAAVYSSKEPRLASELLAKMSWIALDAEAGGKPTAEAWFNPGFFAAAIRQLGTDIGWRAGVAEGADGYLWIKKAISLDPSNAEMQFAAALATFEHDNAAHREHTKRALAGAEPGSPLANTIEKNPVFGNKSVQELRKSHGVADARGR